MCVRSLSKHRAIDTQRARACPSRSYFCAFTTAVRGAGMQLHTQNVSPSDLVQSRRSQSSCVCVVDIFGVVKSRLLHICTSGATTVMGRRRRYVVRLSDPIQYTTFTPLMYTLYKLRRLQLATRDAVARCSLDSSVRRGCRC